MILQAERDGSLQPGGTIVEADERQHRRRPGDRRRPARLLVFVMTDKVAPEKISPLRAYGAEVVVARSPSPRKTRRATTPWRLGSPTSWPPSSQPVRQPSEPAGPRADHRTELWRQTAGRITHFVAGAGTCGTITGTARYLKAQNPDIRIVAADPEGSVFSGGSGRPYLVEGVARLLPDAWQPELYDEIIAVSDEESFLTARRVSQTEGILIGGSGGLAVAAAIEVARRRARRHRRRAQPRLRSRLPVPGVRRRLDGQLRLRPRVRRRVGAVLETRGDGRAALRESWAGRPRSHRRDEVERDQPVPCARTLRPSPMPRCPARSTSST